jgi:2,4-dienoyl-CoA reductase-like NADH-dependent reductase (Old Yellow Enzyme family)
MANQFEYLFTPLKIGPITVRNRIVLSAHVTGLGENHLPTESWLTILPKEQRVAPV